MLMKLAIMQPYFFPYLGYFQLISLVDEFCLLDDVNFIKGGWINRNRIIIQEKESWISVPLKNSSQNKRIKEIEINRDQKWQQKTIKSVYENYKKYKNNKTELDFFEKIILETEGSLAGFLKKIIQNLTFFIGIKTAISSSSEVSQRTDNLKNQEMIIDIAKNKNAKTYVNLPGGKSLYKIQDFKKQNIDLKFIVPFNYEGFSEFEMQYSILHILLKYGLEKTKEAIKAASFE